MINLKHRNTVMWPFLRSGWSAVMVALAELHNDHGIALDGFLDLFYGQGKTFTEPWIGFLHHTPEHPPHIAKSYGFQGYDRSLKSLFKQPNFLNSLRRCQGIYTLSEYTKNYILDHFPDIKVNNLILSTETPDLQFDMQRFNQNQDKKVVMIGHWLRKYSSMFELESPYPKHILFTTENFNFPRLINLECGKKVNDDVKGMNRLSNEEYDDLLSQNIIFLDLYDAAANNVVAECVVRKTPLLIKRLEATEEYLGKEYPYFFDDLEEAKIKINDPGLVKETHEYLKDLPIRHKFSVDYFMKSFVESDIYKNLKIYRKIF